MPVLATMFMTSSILSLQECSLMLNYQAADLTDLLTPGPSLSGQNSGCLRHPLLDPHYADSMGHNGEFTRPWQTSHKFGVGVDSSGVGLMLLAHF